MGLFDFLKKKESPNKATTAKVVKTIKPTNQYDPWENANMPRNDNYAIAAFIYMSDNGASIKLNNDDYPRWFSYEYGVNNPIEYHKKVIDEGYLTEAGPEYSLKSFKVPQLKEILEANNLQTKGKKDDLILRIVENVNIESLSLEKVYIPSQKGEEHLKKYDYIFSLGRYGLTWQEFDHFQKDCPGYLKPNDIIWQILGRKKWEHLTNQSYGLAREDIWYMTKLLESEGKFAEALYHAISVLYFDTSGYCSYGLSSYGSPRKGIDQRVIDGRVTEKICRLKEYFSHSLVDKCYKEFHQLHFPKHLLSKPSFHKLVGDILEDKVIDINKYAK